MRQLCAERKFTKAEKALFVLLYAFAAGFAWRARGDHGWGSFKGMAMVACVVVLTAVDFAPYKKKLNAELFPVVILLTALTNAGYGTFNSQITGLLSSNSPSGVAEQTALISPLSGVAIMLLLGFGWAPFLCAFLGYYYSDKKRGVKDLIIFVAVFFAVDYACRASLAHLAVYAVNPTAVKSFAAALKDAGFEGGAYRAYMSHFSDISFGKKIPFGRNYFQSVECVSQALGSLALYFCTRFFSGDKKGARIQLALCAGLGCAYTAADVFMFVSGGGFRNSLTLPEWMTATASDGGRFFNGWSDWEFFTGFFFGAVCAAVILIATGGVRVSAESLQPARLLPDKKPLRYLWNLACFMGFPTGAALAVPAVIRVVGDEKSLFESFGGNEVFVIVFAAVCVGLLAFAAARFTREESAQALAPVRRAGVSLAVFWAALTFGYFCLYDRPLLRLSAHDYDILTYVAFAVATACMAALSRSRRQDKIKDGNTR